MLYDNWRASLFANLPTCPYSFPHGDCMEKVSIGFVGAGFMGQLAHLVNFTDISQCDVVALAERRVQLGRRVCRTISHPQGL